MGKYDQPAVIDYILAKTGKSALSYVGHSQGCLVLCMALYYRPEYNAKIDAFIAMAPAGTQVYSTTSLRFQAPLASTLLVSFDFDAITVFS